METARPARESAQIGTFGPYRLIRELGRGGQGDVHLAEDTRLGRQVALKILRNVTSEDVLRRFRREAAVASKLDHPAICPVFEAGIHDRMPFIAMRLVEGRSLAALLDSQRRCDSGNLTTLRIDLDSTQVVNLTPPTPAPQAGGPTTPGEIRRILSVIESLARGVHAAHQAGVIHRDLKPANVMVSAGGQPVILDFGMARADWGLESISVSGDVFGTPAYMSPEQVEGERLDSLTDVWSLGVILYECLTLRRPFEGATREALFLAIRQADPVIPRTLNPAITPDLDIVIRTALAREKHHRYQTAFDLAEDLKCVLGSLPIRAKRPSASSRVRCWANRNRAVANLLAVVFVCLSTGLGVALHFAAKAAYQRDRAEGALLVTGRSLGQLVDEAQSSLADLPGPEARAVRTRFLETARENLDSYARWIEIRGPAETLGIEADLRLAEISSELGKPEEAEAHSREAVEACRALRASGSCEPEVRHLLPRALVKHAKSLVAINRSDEAEGVFDEGLRTGRDASRDAPRDRTLRHAIVHCLIGKAMILANRWDYAGAESGYDEATGILAAHLREQPGDELARTSLLTALSLSLNTRISRTGREPGSERILEIIASARDVVARKPRSLHARRVLAGALEKLCCWRLRTRSAAEGLEAATEAVQLRRRIAGDDPESADDALGLSRSLVMLSDARLDTQDRSGALEAVEEARRLAQSSMTREGGVNPATALLDALFREGTMLVEDGERAEGSELLAEAVRVARELKVDDRDRGSVFLIFTSLSAALGGMITSGRSSGIVELADEILRIADSLGEAPSAEPSVAGARILALSALGGACLLRRDLPAAESHQRRAWEESAAAAVRYADSAEAWERHLGAAWALAGSFFKDMDPVQARRILRESIDRARGHDLLGVSDEPMLNKVLTMLQEIEAGLLENSRMAGIGLRTPLDHLLQARALASESNRSDAARHFVAALGQDGEESLPDDSDFLTAIECALEAARGADRKTWSGLGSSWLVAWEARRGALVGCLEAALGSATDPGDRKALETRLAATKADIRNGREKFAALLGDAELR